MTSVAHRTIRWIEGDEDDPLRPQDPGLNDMLLECYVKPLRRLHRRLRGERQAFAFRHLTEELVRMKLVRSGRGRRWGPEDYAEAAGIEAGCRLGIEDVEADVDLGDFARSSVQRETQDLAGAAYDPGSGTITVRVPAALKDPRVLARENPPLEERILGAIEERRLYQVYPEETLLSLVRRATEYPYVYNRAVFEQLSHVAAGHPIPVSGSPNNLFYPKGWAAVLPPLRDLPRDELEAVNRQEAKLRSEWLVLVSGFEEVVFVPSILH